jgi:hypothetical protein
METHVSELTDFLNSTINREYIERIQSIEKASRAGLVEECLRETYDLWMFMNRFRNCDLNLYYSDQVHSAITLLAKTSIKPEGIRPSGGSCNKTIKMGYILNNLVDTGGASFPHRFMLAKSEITNTSYFFEHHVLVSNLRNRDDYKETESFKYLTTHINPETFTHLSYTDSWVDKAEQIKSWVLEHKIDFLIVSPCPAALFVMAQSLVPKQAVLSQDCYTFTLGPNFTDVTFLVTIDQLFKYGRPPSGSRYKYLSLPLHDQEYANAAESVDLSEKGVDGFKTISGSSNMWKSFFGGSHILIHLIADGLRRNCDHHHLFVGTPRCLSDLVNFKRANPDIAPRLHFIGEQKNIYGILKSCSFWINSFPTSGGSDIEAALVGVPSIEFVANRDLTLHGVEFLNSRECIVTDYGQFAKLFDLLCKDRAYREKLGQHLKSNVSREFNRKQILNSGIYDFAAEVLDESNLYGGDSGQVFAEIADVLDAEKFHGLASKIPHTSAQYAEIILKAKEHLPEKLVVWYYALRYSILLVSEVLFHQQLSEIPPRYLVDDKIKCMAHLGFAVFGDWQVEIDNFIKLIDSAADSVNPLLIGQMSSMKYIRTESLSKQDKLSQLLSIEGLGRLDPFFDY